MTRSIRALVAPSLLALSVAGGQSPDSATQKTFFIPRDGLAAGALVGVSAGLSVFDARIARFFRDTSLAHVRHGRKLANDFTHVNETTLTVGGLVVWAVGRFAGWRTVADVAFHTAESVATASLASQIIRGPLGRTRPINVDPQLDDQYDFHLMQGFSHFEQRAFPSIHSASGFAAASAIVAEVNRRKPSATWYVAVPAYALALSPGLSRMYLGQHWASDIVSGAIIGTFFGWRVTDYSHTHPTTAFDRLFLGEMKQVQFSAGSNGLMVGWGTTF